ncbi:MAG: DUF2270 domain-containing protein [Acidobacteria bacterium]|nr:DUF2270 domain-containing protein [Acidobacteriota bacterium]
MVHSRSAMAVHYVDPTAGSHDDGVGDADSFDTAMAHLYRGEMHRMTTWRQRLDVTTNWAMIMALGMTTFVLGSERTPPYILLLGLAAVAMCLVIEARRYQHLHHSLWRLRLLEQHYFVGLLRSAPRADRSWRERLASELASPRPKIGLVASARFRLRRNYLILSLFITAAWLTKVFIHPTSPATINQFYQRLAVGELVPSWLVAITAGAFVLGATVLAATSANEEAMERHASASDI